ncbi:SDR family NAD(P)-dependent oxidoreductase [Streptomyces sp. V4I23]|uniref:SDR family NAD(P)-dependent oxidoreductase n=1 Tax=Streptomyces sp. V4I23 TaxID=3042282 RepID=UPI0027D91EC2|nr:SDR family NAD(P)-dependent oxidoreductase [Streptomyces sp. V4I23]
MTGGARGLGAAHARRLVAEDAKVVIGDVLVKEGQALVEELGARNALFVELDVTSEVSWTAAVARTEEVYGKVTGLVNNAGLVHRCPIEELTEADYRRVIDVNEIGVFPAPRRGSATSSRRARRSPAARTGTRTSPVC